MGRVSAPLDPSRPGALEKYLGLASGLVGGLGLLAIFGSLDTLWSCAQAVLGVLSFLASAVSS
jgi:hypothetical protein